MRSLIGHISSEQLTRYRIWCARDNAISNNAVAYSREELERHHMEDFRIGAEMAAELKVDTSRQWKVTPYDGAVWYQED